MINIKIKFIVAYLVLLSVINNFLFSYDELKKISADIDREVFLLKVEPTLEVEKSQIKYVKTIARYVIYYIFYFDIENPKSVIKMKNY